MTSTDDGRTLGLADRLLFRAETVFNLIAAFSILFLMFLAVLQIIGRTLGYPIWGYLDFVEQAMAVFAFLGIAYCQKLGGHVRMDMLLRGLGGRALWAAEALTVLISALLVAIIIYYAYEHFLRAFEQGDSTIDANFPVWPSKLLVPIAFSLLFLRLALQFVCYARLVVWPDARPVGVPLIESVEQQAKREIEDTDTDRRREGA
ncbi:MAG: TRAP transporter small permease [Pseudomonadota bacterium]|nr:TRAP transporter small permease [Pseudomonadota bacterium]